MDRQAGRGPSTHMEEALRAFYSPAPPDPAFAARLERRLLEQGRTLPGYQGVAGAARPRWGLSWLLLWRRRWAMGTLGLLLALTAAVAAIGPARVWAQVQRLLGYVPGIGFVDLAKARVLPCPVAFTRDQVTLNIDQMVAAPAGTTVLFHSTGLPLEGQVGVPGRRDPEPPPALRLPDGRRLGFTGGHMVYGAGKIVFPPLPEGVYHVTLELLRLPLVPDGLAPEAWEVPLDLQPGTGQDVAKALPQPYEPQGAGGVHEGVSLRVLDVAHSARETALRVQVQWQDPTWRYHHTSFLRGPLLGDALGREYQSTTYPSSCLLQRREMPVPAIPQAEPSPTGAVAMYEETLTFAPVTSTVRGLTLTIDGFEFQVPAQASFTVDLGDSPQVWQHWPLDIDLEVAGLPVHIESARVVEDLVLVEGQLEHRRTLQLDVAPMPERAGRTLWGLALQMGSGKTEGLTGFDRRSKRVWAGLILPQGEPIPSGKVTVRVEGAFIAVRGPWEISWEQPGP